MNFRDYFNYTKDQRIALILLIGVIVLLQMIYCFVDFTPKKSISKDEHQWLSMQLEIDSLKNASEDSEYKIYPFNPNFITDFKGYKLGMSTEEIDRLLVFRKTGKFANSAEEFQQVTKISDSLLAKISPYFKFPDWVNNKNKDYSSVSGNSEGKSFYKKAKEIVVKDINKATKEDLIQLFGIGGCYIR